MSSTKRRDVRVSLREGAEIIHTKDLEDVKQFMQSCTICIKQELKLPYFLLSF